MYEIHLPAVGDIILLVIAFALAGAEAYFHREVRRPQHLWTAVVLVGVGAFAGVMACHYHVGARWAPLMTQLESMVLIFTAHAWLMLVDARSTRPIPIRRSILVGSVLVTMVSVWMPGSFEDIRYVEIAILDHPLPRHVDDARNVLVVGYGILMSAFGVIWLRRHGRQEAGAKWPQRGMLVWAACSLFDSAFLGRGDAMPLQLFEYGAFVLAVSLTIDDLTNYVTLLNARRRDFRQLIEKTPEVVSVVRDGAIVYANPALVAALGDDALIGKPVSLLGIDEPEAGSSYDTRIEGAGRERHFEMFALAVDFDGLPSVVLVGRDVSERDELTARAFELDRTVTIGSIASGVGHEINNPLAYATSSLEEIAEALDDDPEREWLRDRMRAARDGVRRVARIADGLGAFSRSGRELRPTSLQEVVDAAVAVAANEVRQVATLIVDVETDLPPAEADFARLGQVLIHLLVNAAQAIGAGDPTRHRVELRGFASGDEIVFEVVDTGPGFTSDALKKAFGLFYTTKGAGRGSGLGLAVSRESMQAMGGHLEIANGLSGGAIVRGRLRRSPRPKPGAATPMAATPGRRRVLLVDDEATLLRSIARLLRRDADVLTAASGGEAIRLIESHEIDVIITDLSMPDMSGMELHAWALQHRPTLAARMLFATGGVVSAEARAFVSEHSQRVLRKPFEMDELRERIASIGEGG